jgi:hypothetical protein
MRAWRAATSLLLFVVKVEADRARSLQGREVWEPLVLDAVTGEMTYVAVPYVDRKPAGRDGAETKKNDCIPKSGDCHHARCAHG